MRFISRGKARILSWLDQARKHKGSYGEMPSVHGADGVLTDEMKSSILNLVLISADHGDRTIRTQIPVEQLQQAGLVTPARPSRPDQYMAREPWKEPDRPTTESQGCARRLRALLSTTCRAALVVSSLGPGLRDTTA